MNWIKKQTYPEVSTTDKVKILIKIGYKLILIHFEELIFLRSKNHYKDAEAIYISRLYNHYIVKGLGKTEFYELKI